MVHHESSGELGVAVRHQPERTGLSKAGQQVVEIPGAVRPDELVVEDVLARGVQPHLREPRNVLRPALALKAAVPPSPVIRHLVAARDPSGVDRLALLLEPRAKRLHVDAIVAPDGKHLGDLSADSVQTYEVGLPSR